MTEIMIGNNISTSNNINLSHKPEMLIKEDEIPEELKVLKRWITWKYIYDVETGKWNKKPLVEWGNKDVYKTFDEVYNQHLINKDIGVGFVFNNDDNIVGIDIDDCFFDGKVPDEIIKVFGHLNSYTELTPSQKGFHIIGKVKNKADWKSVVNIHHTGCDHMEFYPSGRWFAFTGYSHPEFPRTVENFDEFELGLILKTEPGAKKEPFFLPMEIPNKERNNTLFRFACSARTKGWSKVSILAALKEENRLRCKPPLSDEELTVIAEQAGKYNPSNPIKVEPEPLPDEFADMVIINKNMTRSFNQEKIAQYIHKELKTVAWGDGNIATWDGKKYDTPNSVSRIKGKLHFVAEKIGYTKNIADLEMGVLKRLYHINNISDDNPLGKSYNKLFFNNGVVNVDPKTFEITITQPDPANMNDYILKSNYNPNVNTKKAEKWLEQFGDAIKNEYIGIIGTMFAQKMMYDNVIFKIIFYVIGPKDAGKTYLFIRVLKEQIIDDDNTSGLQLHEFADKFSMNKLVGKIVHIGDDTQGDVIKQASLLKPLSGGSPLYTEEKFKSKMLNRVWPSLLFTGNKLPLFDNVELETDQAFYDRWVIIKLTKVFTKPNLPQPFDNEIIVGIIKLSVDRAVKYLKEKEVTGFNNKLVEELIKYNDNFYRFFDECIIRQPGNCIMFKELTEEYDRFCKNYNIGPRDKIRPMKLREKMILQKIEYKDMAIDRNQVKVFCDIRIRDSEREHKMDKILAQSTC